MNGASSYIEEERTICGPVFPLLVFLLSGIQREPWKATIPHSAGWGHVKRIFKGRKAIPTVMVQPINHKRPTFQELLNHAAIPLERDEVDAFIVVGPNMDQGHAKVTEAFLSESGKGFQVYLVPQDSWGSDWWGIFFCKGRPRSLAKKLSLFEQWVPV